MASKHTPPDRVLEAVIKKTLAKKGSGQPPLPARSEFGLYRFYPGARHEFVLVHY